MATAAGNTVNLEALTLKTPADYIPELTGLVTLSSDMMMVANRGAGEISIFSRIDGHLLARLDKLASRPWNICHLRGKNNTFAVTLDNGHIHILSVVCTDQYVDITILKTLNLTRHFTRCEGVKALHSGDNLLVIGFRDEWFCWGIVSIENGDINAVHKICEGNEWSYLATSPNNAIVYISCLSGLNSPRNGVYAFDISTGSNKFVYKDSELMYPSDICVDNNGFIYVCSYDGSIHLLSESGEKMRVHKDETLYGLRVIYWEEQSGYLHVTQYNSNVVKIKRLPPVFSHLNEQDEEDTGAHPISSKYDILPPEILNMDERFQMLYTEALAAGKEKVYNIRVMIVGHHGVGKTSLTQRLLGEQVKENETESTEGIDIHTRCCQIDHATKNWTRTVKTDELSFNDQRIVSILNNYVPPTNTELTEVMMPDPVNAISPVINSEPSPRDPIVVLPRTLDEGMQSPCEFSQCEESGFTAEESCDVPTSHIAHVNNERKRKTCAAEIQTFFTRSKSLPVPKSGLSDVTLLDFAGQSIFSTTHQAFMSWRTLYLLVTDMSLPLTDAVEEGACFIDVSGKQTCSIQEHVKFWLNSVHSHVRIPQDEQREEKKNKWGESGAPVQGSNRNHPCVILVGTHSDKIPKESLDQRKKAYFNAIRNVLNSHLLLHIADEEFAISNLGSDPNIDALKSKIFDVAQNQVYWGQEIPARWIPLTKALMEKKNSGIQAMDYEEVKGLNETLQVRIENPEELDLFLRFEHDMGNIVFFNNEKLKKKVLLDPEWLIYGVKIWITSDQVIKRHPELSEQWFAFKKTGRLTSTLIENLWASHSEIIQNIEYLLDVMEKLNIIAKPLHKEEVQTCFIFVYILYSKIIFPDKEYYWVPCMVSTPAPDDVKKLQQNKDTTKTSTLCFRSKTKFIHVGVFQRLLATCLSKWTPAKEENLLFRDLCVFDLDEQQQLVLSLNDFVIQATVIRFTRHGRTPDLQLCMTIRNDLYNALSEISDSLCPGSELEICIKCKESSALTNEGLHSISTLRTKDELRCSTHKESHCVESRELLRFWEEENYREIPVNVLPENLARATERFTRLSSLVIDVGTKVLRKVLLHYTSTSLDQYMKNNKCDILKLQSKKVLTQDQVDIIFPQSGQTDPEQYDITLASALLSNIYPSLGKLEKQIIADLRTQRNNLAHYPSTRMSEQDFKAKWTQVTSTLTDLSNLCKDPNFENNIQKEIKDIQQTGPFAVLSHLPEITKELKRVCKLLEDISTI